MTRNLTLEFHGIVTSVLLRVLQRMLTQLFSASLNFYQASACACANGVDLSLSPSVGLCVCLSGNCTVAKWLIGSGCRWDGECGRLRDGCIRWGGKRQKRKCSFWW